jgi:hypothetical protein
MTKLLTKAFEKASKLPDIQQNALAKWVLEELESDRKWESMFAGSEGALDRLAEEALAAHRQGKTKPLDLKAL